MSAAPHLEPVRDRDYIAEMRAVIAAETADGPYVSGVVATHIVNKLRATDRDLLEGWLDQMAVAFVRHAINLRDCSARTAARTGARRRQFAEDAGKFERGNRSAMSHWLAVVHVVEDGSRKKLAEMTAADLAHVADGYEARASENAMTAAFLRALGK